MVAKRRKHHTHQHKNSYFIDENDSQSNSQDIDVNESNASCYEKVESPALVENPRIDILGNGLIIKNTLNPGLGLDTRPSTGDAVTINYKMWLDDGTLIDDVKNVKLTLGEGDIIPAFDLGLPLSELMESFELVTDARFGYGSVGRNPDVPPDAKLLIHAELLAVEEGPDFSTMPLPQRFAYVNAKRERGNHHYRRKEFALAIDNYSRALNMLSTRISNELGVYDDAITTEADHSVEYQLHIKSALYNNLAASQLKIEAYDAAVKSCDVVLFAEPNNVKALYRKGKALTELSEADNAIEVLEHAHSLAPKQTEIHLELIRAKRIRQKQRETLSACMRRRFPEIDSKTTAKRTEPSKLWGWLCSLRFFAMLVAILSLVIGSLVYISKPDTSLLSFTH